MQEGWTAFAYPFDSVGRSDQSRDVDVLQLHVLCVLEVVLAIREKSKTYTEKWDRIVVTHALRRKREVGRKQSFAGEERYIPLNG